MIWLRSLCFNVAFFCLTTVMCFLMLWVLPLPTPYILAVARFWLRQVAWIEKYIGGFDYRVIGAEYIPQGSCIIAAKHQSAWETLKLHLLFRDPAIVLKKELLSIPLWGSYLRRGGVIPIDRKAGTAALAVMLKAAHHAVAQKRKIIIFPQGTRVAPGETRPYKNGVATLYQELAVPVVPMALNSGVYWPKNSFIKKPGTITIEFLPPILPGLSREEFMARLKNELETATGRIVAKAIAENPRLSP